MRSEKCGLNPVRLHVFLAPYFCRLSLHVTARSFLSKVPGQVERDARPKGHDLRRIRCSIGEYHRLRDSVCILALMSKQRSLGLYGVSFLRVQRFAPACTLSLTRLII